MGNFIHSEQERKIIGNTLTGKMPKKVLESGKKPKNDLLSKKKEPKVIIL